jgi:tetratricopeptide (TPR) repeat protein
MFKNQGSGHSTTSKDLGRVEEILEETIEMSKLMTESKVAKELINKTGLSYMQFLATWMGLFESPWSHCNLSQARSIIGYVRSSTRDLTAFWGRKLHIIEEILLDIGEADSECGVLPGGILSLSRRLYEVALNKLRNIPGSTINVILKAHCEAFQLRMQSAQVTEESDAIFLLKDSEETIKLSKLELCTILCNGNINRVYCWIHESLKSMISYHVSFQRDLLAEILLKAAKVEEARQILEEAVKASPMNYDAALSYGAFLLQITCYDNRCSDPDHTKKAQVQLLKSARLDVSKADPFALLGIWFEIQRDLKRSIGCYSKALLIDPSNPVAGRGILRVKKSTDLTSVLSAAIDYGIYQSGWAWKASGDYSAFVEGDYERAIKCYQQALRSHDIWNSKQFRLNIFFSCPGESISSFHEYSNTWSSLGAAYRHLGKYSAALRAFQAAYEKHTSDISYFCSWAQGELLIHNCSFVLLKSHFIAKYSRNGARTIK